jgi:hypothetical protein
MRAAWIAVAAAALLWPGAARAHQEVVGIVQAKLRAPDDLEILLKLDAAQLLVSAGIDPEGRAVARLESPEGQRAVWDYLLRHHEVDAWQGACERVLVRRYALSPSGKWLDIQSQWRCPPPQEYIRVHFSGLLEGEGHAVVGHFDDGAGAVEQMRFGRLSQDWFFFPALPPVEVPSPPAPKARGVWESLWRGFLHAEFFLLPLVMLGAQMEDARTRRWAVGVSLLAAWALALVPGWLGVSRRVPELLGLVSLIGLGAVTARHVLLRAPLRREDIPLAILLGVCAGLSVARTGALVAVRPGWLGALVFAGVWALFGWAGVALGRSPRRRQAAALAVLGVLCFLVTGELYHLVQ